MLNISEEKVNDKIAEKKYESYVRVSKQEFKRVGKKLFLTILTILFLILFLPWTQNIRSVGYITALNPDVRPQTIQSVIDGRIEKWYVREGMYVNKGDTILKLSEVKTEYFDPNLVSRTRNQLQSKSSAVTSYEKKINALENQIQSLINMREMKIQQLTNKLQQTRLKLQADSNEYHAAKINYQTAEIQFKRGEELYKQGLRSLTELENRRVKMQEAQAKMIAAENKYLATLNELNIVEIELNNVDNEYQEKISKAESEKFATISALFDAMASVSKMEIDLTNYSIRNAMYYVIAPQSGYITKAIKTGIGETVKQGEDIITLMPANYQLAVEMYIDPLDYVLIDTGSLVRIQFDGWPALIFSGWPGLTFGTFGGKVVAKDRFASQNGKFRILVAPDTSDHPWPKELAVGGGAQCLALLKTVPVWYELWRQINGFPPEYYKANSENSNDSKKEKNKK
ncbi:MAG: biotin attachment protein [Bacteroidia bacterium]|nr:MAG: biotin attachment protein [Bacteroidia bacterium]